jgi:hypothetical protein
MYKLIVWAFQADDRINRKGYEAGDCIIQFMILFWGERENFLYLSIWTSNVHYYFYGEWRVLETRTTVGTGCVK